MTTLREILHVSGAKGVDIDDVTIILRDKLVPYVNSELGKKLRRPFTEHDYVWLGLERIKILEDAGVTRDDISMVLKTMESDGVIEDIMPQIYSIASLKELSKSNRVYSIASLKALFQSQRVYFLTSRGNGFYNDPVGMTNRWLNNVKESNKNFVPPKVIYNHNKDEAINKYNIKLLFEDNPVFALSVMEKEKVPVILFDAPWNRFNIHDKKALSADMYTEKKSIIEKLDSYEGSLMFRVNSWYDIFKNLVK